VLGHLFGGEGAQTREPGPDVAVQLRARDVVGDPGFRADGAVGGCLLGPAIRAPGTIVDSGAAPIGAAAAIVLAAGTVG
jgi:hypothetical protein